MTQSVDRSKIAAGPCIIQRGATYHWSKGDVQMALNPTSFNIELQGEVFDERDDDVTASIKFTPAGVCTQAMLDEYYPYANAQPGDMMFPGVDVPIVIWSIREKKKYTFACAAVNAQPPLKLAANATINGEVEYLAIRGNNQAASVADSFYKPETFDVLPVVPPPSRADIITMPYGFSLDGATAGSPWANIIPADGGVDVSFDFQTEDVISDAVGLVQKIIKSVRATVSFTPLNFGADDLLTMFKVQGAGSVRGRSRFQDAKDFIAAGGPGNPRFVLHNALPVESANLTWGTTARRAGQVQLRSVRDVNSTGWLPAFTLGMTPVGE